MRLCTLLKSYGKCWYFYFSRQSTCLHSGPKFQPTCCGCDLNVSSTFEDFAKLFRYVWHEHNPVASLGPEQWFISELNTQKFLVCCLGTDPRMCRLGVSPGVHKQPCGVAFLSSSLSIVSWVLFSSLELPFPVFQPEAWGYCYLILPHNLGARQQEERERKKVMGVHPTFLGLQLLQRRESFPSFRALGICKPPLMSLPAPTQDCLGVGAWENAEKFFKGGSFYHSLWVHGVSFSTQVRTRGFILELSLLLPGAYFQVWAAWNPGQGTLEI